MSKKLSIITVTYMNLNELQLTLDSICSNLKHVALDDIELIIIDGGTPNFSCEICVEVNHLLVSEKDDGVFDAMNKGIDLANGEYLLFLNSGDIFYNDNVLSTFLNIYASYNNLNIIAGKVEQVYKNIRRIRTLKPYFNHQSVFIKRKLAVDYRFNSNLKFYGDLDFWKRLEQDNQLKYKRFDFIVSSFFMGGIGNSPRFLFNRLIERNKLCNSNFKKIMRLFINLSLYIIYKLFGFLFYYRLIM